MLAGKPDAIIYRRRRFAPYCDEWLQLHRNRIKESTFVKYFGILEKHIKPRLGGFFVQSLSSVIVEQFAHELLYEQKLSPKTVKDILVLLGSVIKYTARQMPEPLPAIEIVCPKEQKKEMRVLTREEQTLSLIHI